MIVTWRPVVEDERYSVSDHGDVRGPRGKVLRTSPRGKAPHYREVVLWRDGHRRYRLVHRLVLAAFAGPCPVGMQTRHLNGNASDNRLVNLAWGTPSENTFDKLRHGTHTEANRTHCPQGHPYDEANTYRNRDGRRTCKICKRQAVRACRDRQRQAL